MSSSSSEAVQKKTIKLVVSNHRHESGLSDYSALHSITDTVAILKSVSNTSLGPNDLVLFFRGRKMSSQDETLTFEALMQKYHVSMEEDVLVFHGFVSCASTAPPAPPPSVPPLRIPANPHPAPQIATTAPSPPLRLPGPSPPAVPTTQLVAPPPTTPDANARQNTIQVLPIQYQALLVNGVPILAQLGRLPQIRLSSDDVIPVVTHEGQAAYIVSPAGVASLAHQGYRVEVRVLPNAAAAAAAVRAGNLAQPQIPPPERRFGLTDLVSLFRRRLGQQLWLMFKLAFMVGIFSSNNASWRRIIGLCVAAALIFFWQTGELERWAARFRRPLPPQAPLPDAAPALPADQAQQQQQPQEGPIAIFTAALRLAEQVLFVFVASLWPNAVGGGGAIPPELREDAPPAPPEAERPEPPQRNIQGGAEGENPNENNGVGDGENGRERINIVVQ